MSFQVGRNSTLDRTQCFSTHLTSFAGGWIVAPNPIDFNYVFANLSFLQNPTLYVTEIVIAVIFIAVAIWARRQDKKDMMKVGCRVFILYFKKNCVQKYMLIQ